MPDREGTPRCDWGAFEFEEDGWAGWADRSGDGMLDAPNASLVVAEALWAIGVQLERLNENIKRMGANPFGQPVVVTDAQFRRQSQHRRT